MIPGLVLRNKQHYRKNTQGYERMIWDGVLRKAGYRMIIAVVFIIFTGLVIHPVFAYEFEPAEMKEFGKSLPKMYPEMKSMSDLDIAKFVFAKYSELLLKKDAPVNSEIYHRVWGEAYTCGWHTNNLETLFREIGFDAHSIEGFKGPDSSSLDQNRNHQACMIIIDGSWYVFDAWMMGVEGGGHYKKFEEASSDYYNGIELVSWGENMRYNYGYILFTADDENKDDKDVIWDTDALIAADRVMVIPGVKINLDEKGLVPQGSVSPSNPEEDTHIWDPAVAAAWKDYCAECKNGIHSDDYNCQWCT